MGCHFNSVGFSVEGYSDFNRLVDRAVTLAWDQGNITEHTIEECHFRSLEWVVGDGISIHANFLVSDIKGDRLMSVFPSFRSKERHLFGPSGFVFRTYHGMGSLNGRIISSMERGQALVCLNVSNLFEMFQSLTTPVEGLFPANIVGLGIGGEITSHRSQEKTLRMQSPQMKFTQMAPGGGFLVPHKSPQGVNFGNIYGVRGRIVSYDEFQNPFTNQMISHIVVDVPQAAFIELVCNKGDIKGTYDPNSEADFFTNAWLQGYLNPNIIPEENYSQFDLMSEFEEQPHQRDSETSTSEINQRPVRPRPDPDPKKKKGFLSKIFRYKK